MTVQLFEVGGSIRDEILGLENKDRDFVGVCPEGWDGLLSWANETLDKVFLVSPEYFTIRGILDKEVFDIVLARKDGAYSDGRRPDEVEPGTLEDDLARRDFTMNAIARSVDTGEVFDPFSGISDIRNGVIRCVGNHENRIEEDSLRILRALRFMLTKGLSLDSHLTAMIHQDRLAYDCDGCEDCPRISELLNNVSRERVREEIAKMFKADSLLSARILFDERLVHVDLQAAILGDDIWLKPTMERR